MFDFTAQYLNQPIEGSSEVEDLDAVLYELESANIKANTLEISLDFWRKLQLSKYVRLNQYGDIFYKYLKIYVNPKQEISFLLY